jgi:hypothetical protein
VSGISESADLTAPSGLRPAIDPSKSQAVPLQGSDHNVNLEFTGLREIVSNFLFAFWPEKRKITTQLE